jgi:hypothetical protein
MPGLGKRNLFQPSQCPNSIISQLQAQRYDIAGQNAEWSRPDDPDAARRAAEISSWLKGQISWMVSHIFLSC